ncbi:MAG: glycosyltransferase, partial [bacterium]|nr:glycosyltransferase [bacterium]
NRARGEFIAFLDSDDTWSSGKIAVQLEYMRANPNVALICGSMVTRHGNEPFSAVARSSDAVISGYGYNRLLDCNFIFCSSVMVRRAILDSVGVFDESHEMISSEDWDLWMRIARGHRLSLLATQFGSYRIHGSNVSGDARKMGAIESVLRKHLEKRWITVFRLERSMAYFSFGLGWSYVDQAPIEARKMFREALKFADSLSKISWYAMLGLALSFSQSVCRFIKRKLGDRVLKRVMDPREFTSSSGE